MTSPIYVPGAYFDMLPLGDLFLHWMETIPWLDRTSARKECFMSIPGGISYTYGEGRGKRTYTSVEADYGVSTLMERLNRDLVDRGMGPMNGCFLNRYDDHHKALGWHADDFERMDHSRPVCVVSFGEAREIWWRPNGVKRETPPERRQLLEHGSLFIMPPGFQHTHEHRIPKGSYEMGPRVSLTFRAFVD